MTPVDWVVWEGFLGDVTFKLRPGKQQGVNEVKLWPRASQGSSSCRGAGQEGAWSLTEHEEALGRTEMAASCTSRSKQA